ncbi:MAG: hypothetical protein M3Q98_01535 [Actinomycetota bacterium]|nr:hypothetical protein [Actinomycetota bacterium]
MHTFEDPAADADEAQTALRALAHATRSIDDPRQIYSVLGSLTSSIASLSQSLHQLAAFHDTPSKMSTWVVSDSRTARAAAQQVSLELHRSAEILHQVAESVGHAHSSEATITYEPRSSPTWAEGPHQSIGHGLRL